MVVGFNHNVRYHGEVFHVQTEDGGLTHPHIITLLYRGGTILASKKSSYSDIVEKDGLEQVVEELMKEQHRAMLRRLKAGDFDALIAGHPATPPAAPETGPEETPEAPEPSPQPPRVPLAAVTEPKPAPPEKEPLPQVSKPEPVVPASAAPAEPESGSSLDELILAYLVGEEGRS